MPVKHWSFAGLVLTYGCNSRCACCYLSCGPGRGEKMSLEEALRYWRGLCSASPHGCRVHLTGGEPFGEWERLIELCRRARREGLGPLEKVETNAFWAVGADRVRERLRELDAAGMQKLGISADPYHQQFVPIERCRLLAGVAEEVLGSDRVQVRWRDWLREGFDVPPEATGEGGVRELFARYAARRRERLNGRAAGALADLLPCLPAEAFAGLSCRPELLRSRHVHVDPEGWVMPGVCAGIVLGRADREEVSAIWRRLADDHDRRPVVGTLERSGPAGLLEQARESGFPARRGYAGKCHLCWEVRRFLALRGLHPEELGPAWMYEEPPGG